MMCRYHCTRVSGYTVIDLGCVPVVAGGNCGNQGNGASSTASRGPGARVVTPADSSPVADVGVDRIADIIQTGRDHGLPTYTQVTRPTVFMENIT